MDNNKPPLAAISFEKWNGAIKGFGKTYQPNLFKDTGNFFPSLSRLPLAVQALCRNRRCSTGNEMAPLALDGNFQSYGYREY